MENVVVHIISHSHWDREWYLPFESHRMQLVELFDNLFDLFENDPEFKSFHLDGKPLCLMTTWRFALKIATKSKVTLTKANSKLVLFTSCRMTT